MGSTTPLSDCITALTTAETPEAWRRFFDMLTTSQLGVIARMHDGQPVPAGEHVTTQANPVSLGRTKRNGASLILVCADPAVFRVRYPEQLFNAQLEAKAVFETVERNADCAGILVNSAAGPHSAPVTRAQILELLVT